MDRVLRVVGRGFVLASPFIGFITHGWDSATFFCILGAVLLWQGGFDFNDMDRRYR